MFGSILAFIKYGTARKAFLISSTWVALLAGNASQAGGTATPISQSTEVPSVSQVTLESQAPIPSPLVRPEEWELGPDVTALHRAALTGTIEDLKRSIVVGADAHARTTLISPTGREITDATPLHLASTANTQTAVLGFLLDSGADLEAVAFLAAPKGHPGFGVPPLSLAALANPDPSVTALLLERGADLHAANNYGQTALYHAATTNPNPDVVALLLDRGADVNVRSVFGGTPLHAAAYNQEPSVIALLLERGADANSKDNEYITPLHIATKFGSITEAIALLLGVGADINAKDVSGGTPLHSASYNQNLR